LATKKIDKIDIRLGPSKFWSRAIMRLLLYDGRWRCGWSLGRCIVGIVVLPGWA